MGQQQVLLLSFCIVIVGAATIFALVAFENTRADSERETALREAIEITLTVQTWKATSFHEGGGAERPGFFGIDFEKIGLPHSSLSNREFRTESGCFQLETRGEDYDAYLNVLKPGCSGEPYAVAKIVGVYPDDVTWSFDW